MDWKTSSQLEITDLGDRLEIMVRTQQGLLDWLFILVCAPAVVFLFVRSSQFMGILVAIVMGFSLLNNLRKGNETRMIVWSHGFRAEGNAIAPSPAAWKCPSMTFAASVTSSATKMTHLASTRSIGGATPASCPDSMSLNATGSKPLSRLGSLTCSSDSKRSQACSAVARR